MKIIVGKCSGFCKGVDYTVTKANQVVHDNKNVYCLGEIVHNERVIDNLEKKGMIFVNDILSIPDNSKVVFRAHGESLDIYNKAKLKNLDIIDLTCGKIRIIRNKIIKKKDDCFIVIIGKKNHPETIGTYSYAGSNSFVIEDNSDIDDCLTCIKNSSLNKVYIVSQTTFSSSKFDLLSSVLKEKSCCDVLIDKTICNATMNRQEEVRDISANVNKMIIVGGVNSSNTKELYNISKEILNDVYLIQGVDELDLTKFKKEDIVGIMGGASTPNIIIDEIISKLNEI